MNAVIYYSNTGQSKVIARYLSEKLDYPLLELERAETCSYENAVLIFPVYCQNIPDAIKIFLSKLKAKWLSAVATYGRMSYGNVLNEVQEKYFGRIAAAAYIPTKHTYLEEDGFEDFEKLDSLIEKIINPSEVKIPRAFKNPLADIAPALRSRMGVRIRRTEACNECGLCSEICPERAMTWGRTGSRCIRCLKCVACCPNMALEFKCSLPMRLYLKKKKVDKIVLYL